ncbi:MAG: phosphoserine phosphatase SerB [Candidatus Azotimanducaceae bacterium]|uniref:Phosphoserine phosphatase n=1 Tax=OM182 bacterium TaxID=2510334 RepID=A0A520S2N2_9GAMM|nr:MAG: phosphoserine phosphatase SerB [OM182 bacterium]
MLILINIFGEDRPGLTSEMTVLLSEFDAAILDVGQAVIHNHLSLGLLVSLPVGLDSLKKAISNLGIVAKFTPIDSDSYENWVGMQGRNRQILTLLARRIDATHLAVVCKVIETHGLSIDNITRLSGRVPLSDDNGADNTTTKACIEFSLRGAVNKSFREALLKVCSNQDIDIAVQEDNVFRRHRRLIAFDMDSTLIKTEVIDQLAKLVGSASEVAAITEQAMHGRLDFRESLKRRVSLLAGLPEEKMRLIASRLPLTEGAKNLVSSVKKLGYKTAILSGGFMYFGKVLQNTLGIDYVFANELEIINGQLTGHVREPIVDSEKKAELLRMLAKKENISLQQVVAVGDGANDLEMLQAAGLGIAFHAKPFLRENAKQSISTLGLDSILYLMGIRDRDTLSP